MRPNLSRKKKILFGIFAILFGILFAALLTEAGLRFYPPEWLKQQMNSINLALPAQRFGTDAGWSIEKVDGKFVGYTPLTHFKINYYEYQNDVNIDRWGGRVVNGNVNRKDRTVIPFLGDSFMFGVGVEDRETFVSLLNSRSSIQYVNLGVPGSALPQHLDILNFRIHEFGSPPICVFSFFTGNDFADIVKYYTQTSNPDLLRNQSRILRSIDFLIQHFHFLGRSYLVQFCKQMAVSAGREAAEDRQRRRAWTIRTPNGKRLANMAFVLMHKDEPFRKEAEAYLNKSLERLIKLSKEKRFLPVFIIIPDKVQVDENIRNQKVMEYGLDLNDYDLKLPDKIIAEQLQYYKIPYYDLFDCLSGKKGMYYKIDDHFTPVGSRVAAKCLDDLNQMIASHMKKS